MRLLPESGKLFFDPGHAFRRGIFPDDFVIVAEAAFCFVSRAEEACFTAVGQFDDAGFAVNEDAIFGDDPYFHPAAGQ